MARSLRTHSVLLAAVFLVLVGGSMEAELGMYLIDLCARTRVFV